ncbi:MAG: DinB family protein, partial [Solirubrobacteraceae bacterium]
PPGANPDSKSRFEMLLSPKEHEMHHRAQLMTMMRMLGLTPHLTRQFQERMAQAQAAAKK